MHISPTVAACCRRHRWRVGVITLLAAAGLALAGWYNWHDKATERARYATVTVEKGDIEDVVSATGSLQPRDYVDVGAQVSGQLRKIHVEVGSEVRAGELLAEIDATVFRSSVDASRAQQRNLQAQLAERQAARTLAALQLQRQHRLMAEEASTQEQLQQASAELAAADARIAAIEAQIEAGRFSLRASEATLDYARIHAPIAGTVVSISARQGQTLNANQQAPVILRLADLTSMTVQTQVSEADVARLSPGMPAWFTTLGSQGRRWQGTLRKIEPTPLVQNNVVLYNALFDVPNQQGRLMTQMTAQVFFVVAAAEDVLLLPLAALQQEAGPRQRVAGTRKPREGKRGTGRVRSATVRVLRADGRVEQRRIQLGISNRIQVQVLSGLKAGEVVITGSAEQGKDQSRRQARMPAMMGGGMPR